MSDNKVTDLSKVESAASKPTPPQTTAPPVAPPPQDDRGAAARAAGGSTGGRELDQGKSTQKGSTDYFDGKSVVTDADTAIEIGQILSNRNRSELKVEDMAQELRNRGYEVEVSNVDGKKAIRFQNGDVFIDTSGDGQLGSEDVNFTKALSAVEQKHGVNLAGLKTHLGALAQQHRLKKAMEKGEGAGLGLAGLLGDDPGAAQVERIRQTLRSVDAQMMRAGYEGQEGAFDLWQQSKLNPALAELRIPPPDIPSLEDMAYTVSTARAAGTFNLAYEVAELLKGRPSYAS